MRSVQKEQTLNFITVLEEAHEEIKKHMESGNIAISLDLLGQCQEGAISLGNMIESAEGEGFITIGFIEEYCEILYHIYEDINNGNSQNAGNICKILNEQLVQIENSIKNDIKVRREVVFLPYKASMWDSLESVWKAAVEDPECDPYVVVVPYFDKNSNGTFREAHYEGDLFPEYVPVTYYDDYIFEERRPEAVFIHNPYDGCNFVTSVHPFFYSDNLKKFTDMLVYIPYFVLGEINPEDEESVKKVSHFITVPGVVNADKVIVQSEDMKKVYIKNLVDYAGEKSRPLWESKILGIGSPKFDKVRNVSREDVKIPEEWIGLIKKPDGTRKKVILYNTSIGALLEKDKQMLVKIKEVFKTFKEMKDEVVLLWRPHPLIKATLDSMRPALSREYDEIVKHYKEEGFGIYDDTPDMNLSLEISDAYYGDGSSLVQLYKEMGKPVMIQNAEIVE